MEALPEELLDRIVSYVTLSRGDRCLPDRLTLRALSRTSPQLRRITEPHRYRVLDFYTQRLDEPQQLAITTSSSAYTRHATEVLAEIASSAHVSTIPHLLIALPKLQVLDLSGTYWLNDSSWLELLQTPSLRTVYLRQFSPQEIYEDMSMNWEFSNPSINTLHVHMLELETFWVDCDNLRMLPKMFPNIASLHVRACSGDYVFCDLNNAVFGYFIYLWRVQLETTMRNLAFGHTDNNILERYLEAATDVFEDKGFSAQQLLKHSRLEHLKVDTNCLLPRAVANRSKALDLSVLPTTLRTLYLRHVVLIDDTPDPKKKARDVRNREEMACLVRLFVEMRRLKRCTDLVKVSLALLVPHELADVALGIIREATSRLRVPLDLVLE